MHLVPFSKTRPFFVPFLELRSILLSLFLCLSTLLPSIAQSEGMAGVLPGQGTTEGVRDLVKQFIRAWNDDDADRLASLFTNHGTFVGPSGSQASSRRAIHRLLTKEREDLFLGTTLRQTIRSIDIDEEGRAVVRGTFTLGNYRLMGVLPVSRQGSFVMRLVKREGIWRIRHAKIIR